jgi:hypothetical protein
MGWNTTDFDWEDVTTLYNVPTGLLLDDLLAAAQERWSVSSDSSLAEDFDLTDGSDSTVNGALAVNKYTDAFESVLRGVPFGDDSFFVRPKNGSYDWTNETEILQWKLEDLVAEIGPIPDHGIYSPPPSDIVQYELNAPLTAEYCQWWYKAFNKLVRMHYAFGIWTNPTVEEKSYTSGFGDTYGEAKADWEGEPWEPYVSASPIVEQVVIRPSIFRFTLRRWRSKTNQAVNQWKPYQYTGNYTMEGWGRFLFTLQIYDNPDYPANIGEYAKLFEEPSLQSEVANDVEIGYFDNITITTEPEVDLGRGYFTFGTLVGSQLRFDVSGGFEYVAP